ncbi:hypothetical protein GCM10027592_09060 [Spirosoma flavus]
MIKPDKTGHYPFYIIHEPVTHPSDTRAYFFKIDTTIKKIRNALQKQFNDAGFDLTVDQWVVIDHLFRNPGISQNTISEMTTKDAPTVTRIIDLLSQKGLSERRMADSDRRKFLVYLTEAGEAKYHEVLPIVSAMRRKGWGDLSEEDYQHFVRIMDSIYTNISKE